MVLLRIYFRAILLATLSLSVMELRAQEATEPHVLFSFDRKTAAAETSTPEPSPPVQTTAHKDPIAQTPAQPLSQPVVKNDPEVIRTTNETEIAENPAENRRRLAPLSKSELSPLEPGGKEQTRKLPFEIPNLDSLGTAGAGLVLVVGLFLLCVSLMRRGGPSPTSPLPRDAVAVLGRIPLTPKQFAHLLQVGNKLVLVSISGDRTDTITEITEPAEVDRLLMLCMKGSKHSSSAEFQKILGQMAKEPTRGFLGRETAPAYARSVRG